MRILFLFSLQITGKLLPVPIVQVAHQLNSVVTQNDHDYRAFQPQSRARHLLASDRRKNKYDALKTDSGNVCCIDAKSNRVKSIVSGY